MKNHTPQTPNFWMHTRANPSHNWLPCELPLPLPVANEQPLAKTLRERRVWQPLSWNLYGERSYAY